jgi:hypothetical protein
LRPPGEILQGLSPILNLLYSDFPSEINSAARQVHHVGADWPSHQYFVANLAALAEDSGFRAPENAGGIVRSRASFIRHDAIDSQRKGNMFVAAASSFVENGVLGQPAEAVPSILVQNVSPWNLVLLQCGE